jgi:hypothetical protein
MSSDAMVLKHRDSLSPLERETEAVIEKELPIHIKSQGKTVIVFNLRKKFRVWLNIWRSEVWAL